MSDEEKIELLALAFFAGEVSGQHMQAYSPSAVRLEGAMILSNIKTFWNMLPEGRRDEYIKCGRRLQRSIAKAQAS